MNQRNFIAIAVFALAFLAFSQALYFSMEAQKSYCFYKEFTQNTNFNYSISYVVSGMGEDQVAAVFTNPVGGHLFNIKNERDFYFEFSVDRPGEHKICFENLDGNQKILSFDIIEPDVQYATQDAVDGVLKELKKNYKKLELIYRNQHYQQMREETHTDTIISTENRVKWCSIVKILVLTIICLSQIYILTSFFKNRKQVAV